MAELDLELVAQSIGQAVEATVETLRRDIRVGSLTTPLLLDPAYVVQGVFG